jgi:hypothetical protein
MSENQEISQMPEKPLSGWTCVAIGVGFPTFLICAIILSLAFG